MANPYPYDADKIAEYSKQREGVVGYYLYVEDNRLILISGVDYNKESKRIDEVDALCESFGIASPFDTKTDNDLKKYMLYYWQEWHPNYSRIDSI